MGFNSGFKGLMYEFKKKLESYLRVNFLGPGPRLKKKEYLSAVSQSLRNTDLHGELDNE